MERELSKTDLPCDRMKDAFKWLSIAVAMLTVAWPAVSLAAPVVFEAAGSTPADIQAAVEDFRSFLGNNNGVGGSFPDGRREIN